MNRSILVVICDFIVLSMMSLFSGYTPGAGPNVSATKPGGYNASSAVTAPALDSYTTNLILEQLRQKAAELEAMRKQLEEKLAKASLDKVNEEQLKKITEELANIKAKYQYIEKLKQQGTTTLSGGKEVDLTIAELIAQNENEAKNRHLLELELERLQKQLMDSRRDDMRNKTQLEELKQQLAGRDKVLEQTAEALQNTNNSLKTVSSELENKRNELKNLSVQIELTRKDLASSTEKLASSENKLATVTAEAKQYQEKLTAAQTQIVNLGEANKNLQVGISYNQGKLSQTEKELANYRNAQQIALKNLNDKELQLMDTLRKYNELQSSFKTAVNNLSKTQQELKENKNSVASLNNEVLIRERTITDLNKKLRNDVTVSYNNAVLALEINMTEKQLLLDRELNATYYLPQVKISGNNYLISDILYLFNRVRNSALPNDVYALNLSINEIKTNSQKITMDKPILLDNSNDRIAFIEVPAGIDKSKALEIITLDEIKKRDMNEFYLYKPSAAGSSSTALTGRVSMSVRPGGTELIIRNSIKTASELKAEVGDFVLTRQGEFVGVVEQINSSDFGRKNDAKVTTFNKIPVPNTFRQISVKAKNSDGFYRVFQDEMKRIIQNSKK
ncbi:MAG: hypothetical protein MST10_07300 [Lentisphaeria bacterium]|nr:hypothetical protein [Lentisphaeria bacterium]